MAFGRHFRADREFRADDRMKRYELDEQQVVLKIAQSIPGEDRLSAIAQAAGMLRQVKNMNDGSTPVADAVDELLEEQRAANTQGNMSLAS